MATVSTQLTPGTAQYIPTGSYLASSDNVVVQIQAVCTTLAGTQVASSLTYSVAQAGTLLDIENNNGVLTLVPGNNTIVNPTNLFGPYVPAGSYQKTSQTITVTVTASCTQLNGNVVPSTLAFSVAQVSNINDLENNNGVLTVINK